MAEMAMKEYKVYLKEVNWWSTTVTAACEEDAKEKAEEEHDAFEDYEGHGSDLTFLTEKEMDEEQEEVVSLRAKVAELEAQLGARDAEIAQLKGEVKVESEPEVESEDFETQASNLWEIMSDLHTGHFNHIELLIEKFGEEHVKKVFKKDYKLYKDEDESET